MRRARLLARRSARCACAGAALAESLVSTLSDDAVEITSNFTGEQIVVFGAVRGMPADDTDYQVAIVVQGPDQDVVVRRKERLLGIWANRDVARVRATCRPTTSCISARISAPR